MPERWIVGISGASGTIYGRRLIRALVEHVATIQLDVVISDGGVRVMQEEEGFDSSPRRVSVSELIGIDAPNVTIHHNRDTGACIASGSYLVQGMVIVPCSMTTLAAVANGLADTLLRRAADVTLKERRKLVLVPRETPLSAIHLENMLKLSRLGVTIAPAMPGFYSDPKTLDDLINLMVMRIADQLGYTLPLTERWGGNAAEREPSSLNLVGRK